MPSAIPSVPRKLLREVVETLAPIDRTPCSGGEAEAARWLEERFKAVGCDDVRLEHETGWGTFPPTATALTGLGVAAAVLALSGRRVSAALLGALGAAGIVDEAGNGPRVFRRLMRRPKTTVNVTAVASDTAADKTLVVLAHHDAPQSGAIFDQTFEKWLHHKSPDLGLKLNKSARQWWLVAGGPLLALIGAVTGRKSAARTGLVLSVGAAGFLADIWRHPTVGGANDNLSGVGVLVGLADMLRRKPVAGLRVLLVSCGSEETLQDGIRAWVKRHAHELDPRSTWFLSFDTVGSSALALVEGESPLFKETYTDPSFMDLVARCAEDAGVEVERGFHTRASTDAIIPSRAGYPTASFISLEPWGMPANYHLATDTPDRLNYDTVAAASRVAYAVGRALT